MKLHGYNSYQILTRNELIGGIINNYKKYFELIIQDFRKIWLITIACIILLFIYSMIKNSKIKKVSSFFVTILLVIIMMCLSYGVYVAIKKPLFQPRAMYGFGVFISILSVFVSVNSYKNITAKVICILLSLQFIVFTFVYGNALGEQRRYDNFRISVLINDLNDLDLFNSEKDKIIEIQGNIGKSPVLKNLPKEYNILNRLISTSFGGNWYWNEYLFYNYYGLPNVIKSNIHIDEELPLIKETVFHNIRGKENKFLIELK